MQNYYLYFSRNIFKKNAFAFSTFTESNPLKTLYNSKKNKQIFHVYISARLDVIASPINKPK